ncbi:MAG: Uma2 family endonuclease [Gemmatimonadales bacterium]
MGMPEISARRVWTREMVLALPDDGNRYELFDGELLVTPAPRARHQDAALAFVLRLAEYVKVNRIGHLGFAPADLALEGGQLAQPDVYVVPFVEGHPPRDWKEYGIPLLVIEILSPSSARHDRITKRRRYQRTGVPEYWVVDLDARAVERWRLGEERPELLDDSISWHPDPEMPPLTIALPDLFAEIPGLSSE